jgi:replicative DNA helicase
LTIPEIGRLLQYREGLAPITSGSTTIDDALRGGFRPTCLYTIAGRTGSAKSTLALNTVRRAALAGHCVLLFKLEESALEAVFRIHSAASQVDLVQLLDGARLATNERQSLIDGWNLIRELSIRISDRRNLYDLSRIAEAHVADGGRLIVIDQASMIEVPEADSPFKHAVRVSNALSRLACDLRVPVVLVVQVNREASKKAERLTCNDLRDSGTLENDSAGVLLIDRAREPDAPRRHTDPLTLEILVGKNRYGRVTRNDDQPFELLWCPWCCRIDDAARLPGATP